MVLLDSNIIIYAAEPGYDAPRKITIQVQDIVHWQPTTTRCCVFVAQE